MTYLDLVNKVLIALRRPQVSAVVGSSDEYVNMVGLWVQRAALEVEKAWLWHSLRTSAQIELQTNIGQYAITDSRSPSKVLHVYNDTKNQRIRRAPSAQWMNLKMTGPLVTGDPIYFAINGVDVNGDMVLSFWPIPTTADDVIVDLYIHSKIALGEPTTDSHETPAPWDVIVERAKYFAMKERGTLSPQDQADAKRDHYANLAAAVTEDQSFYPVETGAELI